MRYNCGICAKNPYYLLLCYQLVRKKTSPQAFTSISGRPLRSLSVTTTVYKCRQYLWTALQITDHLLSKMRSKHKSYVFVNAMFITVLALILKTTKISPFYSVYEFHYFISISTQLTQN